MSVLLTTVGCLYVETPRCYVDRPDGQPILHLSLVRDFSPALVVTLTEDGFLETYRGDQQWCGRADDATLHRIHEAIERGRSHTDTKAFFDQSFPTLGDTLLVYARFPIVGRADDRLLWWTPRRVYGDRYLALLADLLCPLEHHLPGRIRRSTRRAAPAFFGEPETVCNDSDAVRLSTSESSSGVQPKVQR